MAYNVDRIRTAPGRIFVGVTNPTTGTPPTWMTHTAGVPATGTEIGLTDGDTMFEVVTKKTEIMAEQSYTAVEVYLDSESMKVSFNCQESNFTALKAAFDAVGSFSDSSKEGFYFGTGTGGFTPRKQSVFISAPHRDDPTKYTIALFYRAYSAKGFNYLFSRTKKGMFSVELVGLADLTRTAGDQVGQFYQEI